MTTTDITSLLNDLHADAGVQQDPAAFALVERAQRGDAWAYRDLVACGLLPATKTRFRVEFAAGTSEAVAYRALHAPLATTFGDTRTASVAGVVTGWITVDNDEIEMFTEGMDADERVTAYWRD